MTDEIYQVFLNVTESFSNSNSLKFLLSFKLEKLYHKKCLENKNQRNKVARLNGECRIDAMKN